MRSGGLNLVTVQRRRRGQKSLTNLVRIVSPEWTACVSPNLLFYPVFDEAEALAGVPDRKVVHPTAQHRVAHTMSLRPARVIG